MSPSVPMTMAAPVTQSQAEMYRGTDNHRRRHVRHWRRSADHRHWLLVDHAGFIRHDHATAEDRRWQQHGGKAEGCNKWSHDVLLVEVTCLGRRARNDTSLPASNALHWFHYLLRFS